ncbi:hypothetical protein D3C72_941790 [compost metagenome]
MGSEGLLVKQLRLAEFGHVGEDGDASRLLEAVVLVKFGDRLGEDHVGSGGGVGRCALQGRAQPFHRQGVGAGHDDEALVLAGIHRRLDAIHHLGHAHHRLVGPVAATFLGDLILHVNGSDPAALEGTDGAGYVEGAAPAGVDVHQQWHLGGGGDALGIDEHVVHGGHAQIR